MDWIATVLWVGAACFVGGYEFGKRRGRVTHNHYSADTAHINVMPGATIQTKMRNAGEKEA